ncbi:MAG: hypothetical protein ACUVXJ_01925 [Phycisphaerae bacterium]
MPLGQVAADPHHLHGRNRQALGFKSLNDAAHEPPLNIIGFENDQRSFHAVVFDKSFGLQMGGFYAT